jgi:hypothetical protein
VSFTNTNDGFNFSNTQTLVVRAVPTATGVSPNNAPHAGGLSSPFLECMMLLHTLHLPLVPLLV